MGGPRVGAAAGSLVNKATSLIPSLTQHFASRGATPQQATQAAQAVARSVGHGRRRMNVTNPRALRKALRRVSGFGKMAARARKDIGRAATAVGVKRGMSGRRWPGRKRAA